MKTRHSSASARSRGAAEVPLTPSEALLSTWGSFCESSRLPPSGHRWAWDGRVLDSTMFLVHQRSPLPPPVHWVSGTGCSSPALWQQQVKGTHPQGGKDMCATALQTRLFWWLPSQHLVQRQAHMMRFLFQSSPKDICFSLPCTQCDRSPGEGGGRTKGYHGDVSHGDRRGNLLHGISFLRSPGLCWSPATRQPGQGPQAALAPLPAPSCLANSHAP